MKNWQNKKILVVDDISRNCMIIEDILEETEIQITLAHNGKKAIEFFAKEYFDIILMDIDMPIMNGFEATKEIRKFNQDIIIIAQTANESKREDFLAAGFTDYISKPYNHENLIQLIKKYIDS